MADNRSGRGAGTVRRKEQPATRERILAAAAEIFAAHGFRHATVRDICRQARANVAAVNYYFHGKMGLYKAVLHAAIEIMRRGGEGQVPARGQAPPRERLEAYFLARLQILHGDGQETWIHRLLSQENTDPTPAFGLLIEHVYRPSWLALADVVADCMQLPCNDWRVQLGTGNALGATLIYIPGPIRNRLSPQPTPEQRDAMARELAGFMWAGMQALARRPPAAPGA